MSERLNFIKSAPIAEGRTELETKAQSAAGGRWQRVRPHLVALGLYTVLLLLFAWPALLNLANSTPGDFVVDRNQNLWNAWWFRRSLLETHTNPYQSTFIFYPYGVSLYLHTFSPYNLIIGLPLQLLFGLIPAYGLLELSTFILAPYGGYLLARHLVKNEAAALFGGAVYGFCAYHYVELLMDQMNLVALQWLPFFILFLIKTEQATTRRELLVNGGLTTFFFLLNMMVEFYYAIYLVMFAGLWWLWQAAPLIWQALRAKREKFQLMRPLIWLTARMAAIFGVAGVIFSPVIYATVREISSGRYQSLENNQTSQVHSADLLNMWLPPAYHPIWGASSGLWQGIKLNPAGAVPGYVALALGIYALVKIRGLWFWGASGLFWLIISFGPTLRINGEETGFPMPYRLLSNLPLFNITRSPQRFMLMLVISLAVLSAFALARIMANFSGWRKFGVFGLALALLYLELTPGFLPTRDKIGPFPFAEAMQANNGKVAANKAILELPITKHQNPDSPRMLYQIYHGRPIIGGYISRKLRDPYRENDYALFDFVELRKDEPDIVPHKSAEEWRGLLNYANMGYLVLYPGDFSRDDGLKRAQDLIDRALGKVAPIYQDNLAKVYQIPAGKLEKPLIVLSQGWAEPEVIDKSAGRAQRWLDEVEPPEEIAAQANIVVGPEVKLQESYTLQLEAISFAKPRRLQIFLNNTLVREVSVPPALDNIEIAGLKLKPGDNHLELRPIASEGYSVPAEIISGSQDTRKLRIAIISLAVK